MLLTLIWNLILPLPAVQWADMSVQQILLETLEELCQDDFSIFKSYLSDKVLDSCTPIRAAHLENATRMQTAKKMIDSYKAKLAVKVTAEILKRMNFNSPAETLLRRSARLK